MVWHRNVPDTGDTCKWLHTSPLVCKVCGMPDTLSGRVAANLRGELARRNLTHEEFAAKVGISRQAITNRVLGRTPISLDELATYAALLEIEPAKLLND